MDSDYPLGCTRDLRPPRTDDLDSWGAWYDHLVEMQPAGPA